MTQSKYSLSMRMTARGLIRSDISAEVAQVDQHQGGGDLAHVAAAHLAFENEPAGLGADIGGQHVADKPAQRLHFDDRRQCRQHIARTHLGGGKPAGPLVAQEIALTSPAA